MVKRSRSRYSKKHKGGQLFDQLSSMAQQASQKLVEQGKQLTKTAADTVQQLAKPVSQAVVQTSQSVQPVVQQMAQPVVQSAHIFFDSYWLLNTKHIL